MNAQRSPRTPIGGGCLLSAAIMIGVAVGIYYRQTSVGFLAGAGIGLLLVAALLIIDRRR
mgnify:CR=1 FL=1